MLKGVQTMTRIMLGGDVVMNVEQLNAWKDEVYPVIVSKTEEFHLYGYDAVTPEEVWECVLAKLERRKGEYMLHQLVAEIFRLTVNEYMNWLTIKAVTSAELELLEEENNLLFGID